MNINTDFIRQIKEKEEQEKYKDDVFHENEEKNDHKSNQFTN